MNNLQKMETEDYCLKCTDEPGIKALSSEWDTHIINWLPSFGTSTYVFSDEVTHTRLGNGVPVTTKKYLGFTGLMQLPGYLKTTYGEDNPIYAHAKEFFSGDE